MWSDSLIERNCQSFNIIIIIFIISLANNGLIIQLRKHLLSIRQCLQMAEVFTLVCHSLEDVQVPKENLQIQNGTRNDSQFSLSRRGDHPLTFPKQYEPVYHGSSIRRNNPPFATNKAFWKLAREPVRVILCIHHIF